MTDDFIPTPDALLAKGRRFAAAWGELGELPPLRVVPDGEGGMSIECRSGTSFWSLDIERDGTTVRLLTFEHSKLVHRGLLANWAGIDSALNTPAHAEDGE